YLARMAHVGKAKRARVLSDLEREVALATTGSDLLNFAEHLTQYPRMASEATRATQACATVPVQRCAGPASAGIAKRTGRPGNRQLEARLVRPNATNQRTGNLRPNPGRGLCCPQLI